MDSLQKENQIKKDLNDMRLHQSIIFKIESGNTPVKSLLVTKVIGGWIYIIDYGTTSESPIFIPQP